MGVILGTIHIQFCYECENYGSDAHMWLCM